MIKHSTCLILAVNKPLSKFKQQFVKCFNLEGPHPKINQIKTLKAENVSM